MDGTTAIDREAFFDMLARVTPALTPGSFRILPWKPRVALALFVHRVRGLEPGLYVLLRDPSHRESLQSALDREFVWQRPLETPPAVDLYLLQQGDAREAARIISCQQEIASHGAFAVSMLAELRPTLDDLGAWFYRALFWETGLIGQMLYLEAEAAGVRATGIGCFFDDEMHRLLGMTDQRWQSLYHFTVGGAVEDTRLVSLPAYHHLG
jgi:nitroreductase